MSYIRLMHGTKTDLCAELGLVLGSADDGKLRGGEEGFLLFLRAGHDV